jgi:hypothetical protein
MGEEYIVYHLTTGQMIVGEVVLEDMKEYLDYPMTVMENPQISPTGGIQIMSMLIPFASHHRTQRFKSSDFLEFCVVCYFPDQSLIDTYKRVVKQFRAKQSGIVIPEMR